MRARDRPGYAMVALCLGKITLGEFTGEKQGKEAREEVVGDEHSQAFPKTITVVMDNIKRRHIRTIGFENIVGTERVSPGLCDGFNMGVGQVSGGNGG